MLYKTLKVFGPASSHVHGHAPKREEPYISPALFYTGSKVLSVELISSLLTNK